MAEQVGSQRTSVQNKVEGADFTAEQVDVTQDHTLWTSFAEAASVEAFCQSWLALQCRMLGGIQAGIVLLGPPDRGPFRPVATWPEGRHNLKHLTKTAEKTLADRQGIVSRRSFSRRGWDQRPLRNRLSHRSPRCLARRGGVSKSFRDQKPHCRG